MTRERQEALFRGLLSAFPSSGELEQMLDFGLGWHLAEIASGNLREQAYGVIKFAEARGRFEDLLAAARKASPANAELRAVPDMPIPPAPVPASQPASGPPLTVDKRTLRKVIQDGFSLEEIAVLCSDLADARLQPPIGSGTLSLDDLAGETKQAKIVSLIEYFDRRDLLNALVEAVRTERPGRL